MTISSPGGAFFVLEAAVGSITKQMGYVKNFIADKKGLTTSIVYLSQEQGGGYFSKKMRELFVASIKEYALGLSWTPSYNPRYEKWKKDNYPGKGPWIRTGLLLGALGTIREEGVGATVGFNPKFTLVRHGFKDKEEHGRYSARTIASRMEYGYNYSAIGPNMPARPLFAPGLLSFMRKYYKPGIKTCNKAIVDAGRKHFNIPKTEQNFVSLSGANLESNFGTTGSADADKWLAEVQKVTDAGFNKILPAQDSIR